MPSSDPLDAPMKEPKALAPLEPYICSPKQMVLFKRALLVVVPFNTCFYALLFVRQWTSEYFFWGISLQGIIGITLGVIVGVFAMGKRRGLVYAERFWQWFVLYYLSVQILFAGLLVLVAIFQFSQYKK